MCELLAEELDMRVLNPWGVEIHLLIWVSSGLRNCICSNGIGKPENGEFARACLG